MRRQAFLETEPYAGEILHDPAFGFGLSVPRRRVQGEVADDREAPGVIFDPSLGFGRSVPRQARGAGVEPESGELEVIFDPNDDRHVVRNTLPVPYRWVCALELNFGADPDNPGNDMLFRGSGTLISPRHVLTCGHVLFNQLSTRKKVVRGVQTITVVPGRNGLLPNQAILGSSRAAGWRYSSFWQRGRQLQFDFGLITLKTPLGNLRPPALRGNPLAFWGNARQGGGTRINPLTQRELLGRPAEISGYAGDKCRDQPPVGGLTAAQAAACPVTALASAQWNATGKITNSAPRGGPRLILYNMDTVGGHSGSPVWLNDLNLVGIHTGPGRFVPGERPGVSNRGIRITAELLREINTWRTQAPVTPAPRVTLRLGSQGLSVFELQTRLNLWLLDNPAVGVPLLVVDGIFGPKTRAAVITFQRAMRIQVDGVVGPQTRGALDRVLPPLP